MPEIGSLMKVPIREVWPNEAVDLTPWLAENPDILSEALGMDLALDRTEAKVGESFSADILFHAPHTNALVVVENMMGSTDHDHLGKTITYASGLEAAHEEEGLAATYAVLLAERVRDEHRTALTWMNTHTKETVGFFGVEIEVWRIGNSLPAPRINVVVKPDQWAREVRAKIADSAAQRQYLDFWTALLPEFQAAHPGWSDNRKPQRDNWMEFPAGRSGMYYAMSRSWTGKDKPSGFRVEFTVNRDDEEGRRIFDALRARSHVIEERFGESLTWDEVEGRKARRIFAWHPGGDEAIQDRERWPEVRAWAIKCLGDLRDAIRPHLDELAADDG